MGEGPVLDRMARSEDRFPSPFVGLKEMARILKVHPMTLYRLAKQKRISYIRVGAKYLFHPERMVEDLVEKTRAENVSQQGIARHWKP